MDLQGKSFEELSAYLKSNSIKERESAAYYLGDRLQYKAIMQNDFARTFTILKQRLAKENTEEVINVIWMSISNMFRGNPGTIPAKLFDAERQFFIKSIVTNQQRIAVQNSLFLVAYHKSPWAKSAVVKALSFSDESIKIEAMKAVIALQIYKAQALLLKILKDPDKGGSLHTKCIQTLGSIGDTTVIPELQRIRDILTSQGYSTAEPDIAIKQINARKGYSPDSKK